jgi:hypothetical protein
MNKLPFTYYIYSRFFSRSGKAVWVVPDFCFKADLLAGGWFDWLVVAYWLFG